MVYGDYLLFRDVAIQVPSAMKSLTTVFGMGTGGSSSLLPPYWLYHIFSRWNIRTLFECFKAHSQLHKSFSQISFPSRYLLFLVRFASLPLVSRLSPRPISINQLNTLLYLHLWPINLVVFKGSYSCDGISYLKVGFTLRCFQRLSRPYFATRPCCWNNNRYTIGTSIPVLSY